MFIGRVISLQARKNATHRVNDVTRVRSLCDRTRWSRRPESNRGPSPYQGDALPAELHRRRNYPKLNLLKREGESPFGADGGICHRLSGVPPAAGNPRPAVYSSKSCLPSGAPPKNRTPINSLPACRSPLPAKALACEAGGWSRREESNPQPIVYKTIALPLSYSGAWATGRQAKHLLFRKRSSAQKSEVRPKPRPEKLLKRRRRPRLWKF